MGGKGNKLTILASGTYFRGDVFSDDILIVEGGLEGNLMGNRVIVKSTGWIHGNVTCRSLSIELGGIINGSVRVSMGDSLPPATAEAQLPPSQEDISLPDGSNSTE